MDIHIPIYNLCFHSSHHTASSSLHHTASSSHHRASSACTLTLPTFYLHIITSLNLISLFPFLPTISSHYFSSFPPISVLCAVSYRSVKRHFMRHVIVDIRVPHCHCCRIKLILIFKIR